MAGNLGGTPIKCFALSKTMRVRKRKERILLYFDGTSWRHKGKLYSRTKFLEKQLLYKAHKRRSHSGLIVDLPLWASFSYISEDNRGGSWTLDEVLGCYYEVGNASNDPGSIRILLLEQLNRPS